MELLPTELAITGNRLVVRWNDDTKNEIEVQRLRDRCPCATCREKKKVAAAPSTGLPILNAGAQEVSIDRMEPVGNYAYTIFFSDGHASGIFTFDYLKSL